MNKKLIAMLTVIVAGVLLLWSGRKVYVDYWLTTQDMHSFGIDWVRLWTPRAIERTSWFTGEQVVYTFQITPEVEQQLRTRCLPDPAVGSCYLSKTRDPDLALEVQRGTVKLSYTVN